MWVDALLIVDRHADELLRSDGIVVVQIDPREDEFLELQRLHQFDKRTYGNTLLSFTNSQHYKPTLRVVIQSDLDGALPGLHIVAGNDAQAYLVDACFPILRLALPGKPLGTACVMATGVIGVHSPRFPVVDLQYVGSKTGRMAEPKTDTPPPIVLPLGAGRCQRPYRILRSGSTSRNDNIAVVPWLSWCPV